MALRQSEFLGISPRNSGGRWNALQCIRLLILHGLESAISGHAEIDRMLDRTDN